MFAVVKFRGEWLYADDLIEALYSFPEKDRHSLSWVANPETKYEFIQLQSANGVYLWSNMSIMRGVNDIENLPEIGRPIVLYGSTIDNQPVASMGELVSVESQEVGFPFMVHWKSDVEMNYSSWILPPAMEDLPGYVLSVPIILNYEVSPNRVYLTAVPQSLEILLQESSDQIRIYGG